MKQSIRKTHVIVGIISLLVPSMALPDYRHRAKYKNKNVYTEIDVDGAPVGSGYRKPYKNKRKKSKDDHAHVNPSASKDLAYHIQTLTFKDNKEVMDTIYNEISGFKGVHEQESQMIISQGGAPTYGEITYESLQQIIDDLQLGVQDVFYDLGSGVGKVTTQMALNTPIKKAVGVELSPTRYQGALAAKERLQLHGMYEPSEKLVFINDDMLKANIDDATVVYLCSTCFSNELMKALTQRFATLKPGLKVLTLRELPEYEIHGFKLVKHYYLPMTWTLDSGSYVYMYELA